MSLRDQLMKKGLVSKKDAARVGRQAKNARKKKQGSKKRKSAEKAEAARLEQETQQARVQKTRADRLERNALKDALERALQVRNLLLGNRLQNRGNHPFHFRERDGVTIGTLALHPRVAWEIARGALGIACLDHGNRVEYILVPRRTVERLREIGSDVVVHAAEPAPLADHEQLLERDWELSMVPHRLKPES